MAVGDFRVEAVEEGRVLMGALGCSYLFWIVFYGLSRR